MTPEKRSPDRSPRSSLKLVAKLFGAAATIAFGIKYGITAVNPTFTISDTISAFDDKMLNTVASIAIIFPSLVIALILLGLNREQNITK